MCTIIRLRYPLIIWNENGLPEPPGLPECSLHLLIPSRNPGYPRRVRVSLSELSEYRFVTGIRRGPPLVQRIQSVTSGLCISSCKSRRLNTAPPDILISMELHNISNRRRACIHCKHNQHPPWFRIDTARHHTPGVLLAPDDRTRALKMLLVNILRTQWQ